MFFSHYLVHPMIRKQFRCCTQWIEFQIIILAGTQEIKTYDYVGLDDDRLLIQNGQVKGTEHTINCIVVIFAWQLLK